MHCPVLGPTDRAESFMLKLEDTMQTAESFICSEEMIWAVARSYWPEKEVPFTLTFEKNNSEKSRAPFCSFILMPLKPTLSKPGHLISKVDEAQMVILALNLYFNTSYL